MVSGPWPVAQVGHGQKGGCRAPAVGASWGAVTTPDQAVLADRIAAERDRTEARIAALQRDFEAIVAAAAESPPDDEHDPEGTTIAFERSQTAALMAEARARLDELDRAADRLAEGSYGTCDVCARPIAHERLLARPTARTCVACAATAR